VKAILAIIQMLISFPVLASDPRPFVQGSWQELRQEHSGRPMVVHFWGLTCGPCLIELPQWGKLLRERPNLDIVMIAADPVLDEPGAINGALSRAGCTGVESWMFADGFTERLIYEVDPQWAGELPYTLLIGRDGSETTKLGAVDFSEIRNWAGRQSRETPPDR
jgi:thiol-disulfide isomerase/thioredoxin